MTLGQLGPSQEAEADDAAADDRPALGDARRLGRERLLQRVRSDVIAGLEELVDPTAPPATLVALADRHSLRLRRELERPESDALFELDDPHCAAEREWIRCHLHDTALQILELIAGDGFGAGMTAPQIANLAGGAARDLRRWVDRVEQAAESKLLPELELILEQARMQDARVELVVGAISTPPSPEQVDALAGAFREAVTNIRKHADASHVIVRVESDQDGRTAVTVTDNGVGIDVEQVERSRGLGVKGSIVGRMTRVGGHASLQGAPGGGTRVTLVTPGQRARSC